MWQFLYYYQHCTNARRHIGLLGSDISRLLASTRTEDENSAEEKQMFFYTF